jgi:hypothetical protein
MIVIHIFSRLFKRIGKVLFSIYKRRVLMCLPYIYIYIYTHTHIYIYTHTERDQQLYLQRTAPCLQLRPNYCNYNARDIRCTWAPTAASTFYFYIYIHIQTHTQRQASKSIYHARLLVCSYGEMIASKTHENFAAHARPQRQVHVPLYINIYIHTYIYIYTHTHTEIGQQFHLPRTAP